MKCRDLLPDLIDVARGVPLEPSRERALADHLRTCAPCAARLETERAMSAALQRLAREAQPDSSVNPAVNDVRLGRLLAAFDAPRWPASRIARRRAARRERADRRRLVRGMEKRWPKPGASSKSSATSPAPPMNAGSAFVVLPGADALPRFDHGEVIRVDIPSAGGVIQAEVLIGQDGLARAARLVQ
jgi:anti-sigma factor RsiW